MTMTNLAKNSLVVGGVLLLAIAGYAVFWAASSERESLVVYQERSSEFMEILATNWKLDDVAAYTHPQLKKNFSSQEKAPELINKMSKLGEFKSIQPKSLSLQHTINTNPAGESSEVVKAQFISHFENAKGAVQLVFYADAKTEPQVIRLDVNSELFAAKEKEQESKKSQEK